MILQTGVLAYAVSTLNCMRYDAAGVTGWLCALAISKDLREFRHSILRKNAKTHSLRKAK
jgi:hypothetical protein